MENKVWLSVYATETQSDPVKFTMDFGRLSKKSTKNWVPLTS